VEPGASPVDKGSIGMVPGDHLFDRAYAAQIRYYIITMEKSFLRRIMNRILAALARFGPGATTIRPFLHRLRGVRITGRVFIGDDVYIENEYPECVELEDGAQICLRSLLIAHTRAVGRIVVKKNAFIGASCVITAVPGRTLTIGEGSVVTAASVVSTDVPPRTLFGIEKAKPLAQVRVPLTMDTDYEKFVAGLRPLPPLK
jgi:serine acetyltransferase